MDCICVRWSRHVRGGTNFPLSLITNSNLKDKFIFCEKFDRKIVRKFNYFVYVDLFTDDGSENNEVLNEVLFLNDNNKSVFYLESNDSAEVRYPQFVRYFKLWFKKQLYRDLNNYLKPFYGGTVYSDFYINEYDLNKNNIYCSKVMDCNDLVKLDLFWNILIGPYPIKRFKQSLLRKGISIFGANYLALLGPRILKMEDRSFPKRLFCHGRFSGPGIYTESIGYQRYLLLKEIQNDESILTGYITQKEYNRELAQCQVVLSPFGWGEICHRDAEAIHNKGLLLKPNMDHIRTIPNIYESDKMYISINWDLSNLQEVFKSLKVNSEQIEKLSNEAYQFLKEETNSFDKYVLSFYNKLISH